MSRKATIIQASKLARVNKLLLALTKCFYSQHLQQFTPCFSFLQFFLSASVRYKCDLLFGRYSFMSSPRSHFTVLKMAALWSQRRDACFHRHDKTRQPTPKLIFFYLSPNDFYCHAAGALPTSVRSEPSMEAPPPDPSEPHNGTVGLEKNTPEPSLWLSHRPRSFGLCLPVMSRSKQEKEEKKMLSIFI